MKIDGRAVRERIIDGALLLLVIWLLVALDGTEPTEPAPGPAVPTLSESDPVELMSCSFGCPKLVIIDAAKMPYIARNIDMAIHAGKPEILYRGDPARIAPNRAAACKGFRATHPGGSCDEYPFASSQEGGAGAQVHEVPLREQNCQGGTIGGQYRRGQIGVGMPFLVTITHRDRIAPGPYAGQDIAVDKGACG